VKRQLKKKKVNVYIAIFKKRKVATGIHAKEKHWDE
jgi:hypothetical protein